jgi:hypothetical protein
MNAALIAQIMGWGQFALTVLGQVATVGLPTGAVGWLAWVSSLAVAIGTHAASTTGAPPKT